MSSRDVKGIIEQDFRNNFTNFTTIILALALTKQEIVVPLGDKKPYE